MADHSPAAASDAADSDLYADTPHSPEADPPRSVTPSKRKRSYDSPAVKDDKRRRTDLKSAVKPELPWNIWQTVFSYLSPRTLAPLLRVNGNFNACLTISDSHARDVNAQQGIQVGPGNTVWKASRFLHFPTLPEPLAGRSELDMWRLLRSSRCSSCGSGPRSSGIQCETFIAWPFAVRLCSKCLADQIQDERELLLSDASSVRHLLPWAYVTDTFRLVPSLELKDKASSVTADQVKKVFHTPVIKYVQQMIDNTGDSGRTRELCNDLQIERMARMSSVDHWERWERHGGFDQIQTRIQDSVERQSRPSTVVPFPTNPLHITPPLHHPLPGSWAATRQGAATPRKHTASTSATSLRNQRELSERKNARKTEIEQRCREVDPPIPAKLLPHMSAFNAAIQIGRGLTEDDWGTLKPRLIAERSEAEEKWFDVHKDLSPTPGDDTKEAQAQAWEISQKDIRDRLASYAERAIANDWRSGALVSLQNAADFASVVLRSVRDQWETDRTNHGVSSWLGDPKVTRGFAVPPGDLTLDAMKWVYSAKIKPIAEKFKKELFLCNECDANMRIFSFEACIQHYSSLHTNEFGEGSSGVSWKKALWPFKHPFASDPSTKVAAMHTARNELVPGTTLPTRGGRPARGRPQNVDVTNNQPFPVPQSQAWHPQMNQYGQGMPNNYQYQHDQQTAYGQPYYPPQGFPSPAQTPFNNYGAYSRPTTVTPNHPISWAPPPVLPLHPSFSPPVPPGHGPYRPPPHHLGPPYPHAGNAAFSMPSGFGSALQSPVQAQPPHNTLYQEQLDELARIARDVYVSLSNLPSMPPSVSIHSAIHQSVSHFTALYMNKPSLELFQACVFNHAMMAQIRAVGMVSCKICKQTPLPETPHQDGLTKMYAFPELLMHFKLVHVDPARRSGETPADWKEGIVDLPTKIFLHKFVDDHTMDPQKRDILLDVFQDILRDTPEDLADQYDPHRPAVVGGEVGRREGRWDLDHQQRSRDSSDHTTSGRAAGRIVHLQDGNPYELVPRDRGQRRGDYYEDPDTTRYYERSGNHNSEQTGRRRKSHAPTDRPIIKQEPSDDELYVVPERQIRGAASRK